jgi:hypothetical protein
MAEPSANINDASYKNVQLYSQDASRIYPNVQIENIRSESSIWEDFHGIDLLFRTFSYQIGEKGISPIAANSSLLNIVAYENSTRTTTGGSLVGKQILLDPSYIQVDVKGTITSSNPVANIIYPSESSLSRILYISRSLTQSQPVYTDVSSISVGHSDYAWCIGSSTSRDNTIGSSQLPVYVDASGKITQCGRYLDVSVNHAKNSFFANAAKYARGGSATIATYALGTVNTIYEDISVNHQFDNSEGNDIVSVPTRNLLNCGDASQPVCVSGGVITKCLSYSEASVKYADFANDATFAAKIGKSADESHNIGNKNTPVFITTTGDVSTCTQYSDAEVSHARTADKSKFATDASYADKIGRDGQAISIGDISYPVYIEDGSIKRCSTLKQSFVSAYADLAHTLYDHFDAKKYKNNYPNTHGGRTWDQDHPDDESPTIWNIPDNINNSDFVTNYITYLNAGDSCTAVYFYNGRPAKCTTIKNAKYSEFAQYIGNSSAKFLAGDSNNPIYLKDGSLIACIPYEDASVKYAVDSSKSKYAENLLYKGTEQPYNSIPYKQNNDTGLNWTRPTTQADQYKALIVNENNDLVWGWPNARSTSKLSISGGNNQLIYQKDETTTSLVDPGTYGYILQYTNNSTLPFKWTDPTTIIPNESKHSKTTNDASCSKYATLIANTGSTSDSTVAATIGNETTPVYVKDGSIRACTSYDLATVGTAKYAKDGSVSAAQYAISGTINKIYSNITYEGSPSSSNPPQLNPLNSIYTDKKDHYAVYVDNGELKPCNAYLYGARQSMVGSWAEHCSCMVEYDSSIIEEKTDGKYSNIWVLASSVEKSDASSIIEVFNDIKNAASKYVEAGNYIEPVYFCQGRPKKCGSIKAAQNLDTSTRTSSTGVLYQYNSSTTEVLGFTQDASSKKQYVRISDDGKSLKWDYAFLPMQTVNDNEKYYVTGVSNATGDTSTLITQQKCFIKGGYFYQQSDETLKDIVSEYQLSLEQLHNIRKILYKWNNGTDNIVHLGVIAQDIEKIAPEIVSTDDSGIKSVSYSLLSVLALSAIDQLYDKIQLLESKNKTLENRLDKIEAILNN